MINTYKRIPSADIEAIQYTGDNLIEVLEFTGKHPKWDEWFESFEAYQNHVIKDDYIFKIITDVNNIKVFPGDYVVKHIDNNFYKFTEKNFNQLYIKTNE